MSSILGKAWLPAIAVLAVFAMFAFGNQVRTAYADIEEVYIVDPSNDELYDDDGSECYNAAIPDAGYQLSSGDKLTFHTGEQVGICFILDGDWDTLNGQASAGKFNVALCNDQDDDDVTFEHIVGNWDDECEDQDGKGTADLTVYCGEAYDSYCTADGQEGGDCGEGDACEGDGVIFVYECPAKAAVVNLVFTHDDDQFNLTFNCWGEPDNVTVSASPTKVEIVPALGSVAHSEIKVVVSSNGLPVDPWDTEIDFTLPKCAIEIGIDNTDDDAVDPSPLADSTADSKTATSDDESYYDYEDIATVGATSTTFDNIWFHADWNKCTPGDVVVTVTVEVEGGADIVKTVTINVVGPPAFITATAAPTSLICGEKSTITVKVTDAIGQNVSDNTQVELISNWGSVIAGTGATLAFPGTGPVNPLASSAAATYNGVAIAYLLTSNNHVGPYEVVAAAGGTLIATPYLNDPWYDYGQEVAYSGGYYHYGHSDYIPGAPITTQVTVTCSLPAAPVAPTVTAPTTGTGSITPPNTGDAGLASSSSNAMLFVIVGAAAFVLAGIASVSYARR